MPIGAGSGGQLPPHRDILAPPGRLFPPLRLLSWANYFQWAIIFRERWFLGQKDAPDPEKTFFF